MHPAHRLSTCCILVVSLRLSTVLRLEVASPSRPTVPLSVSNLVNMPLQPLLFLDMLVIVLPKHVQLLLGTRLVKLDRPPSAARVSDASLSLSTHPPMFRQLVVDLARPSSLLVYNFGNIRRYRVRHLLDITDGPSIRPL